MKLNKLASAVSVSLAALVLTACGSSDDDQPIKNTTTVVNDDAAKQAEATAKQQAEQAKIASIKSAAVAQGLPADKADAFAQANKDLIVGSAEFDSAVKQAIDNAKKDTTNTNTNPGNNTVISDVIVKTNPLIDGFDASVHSSVNTGHYVRDDKSNFDRKANPDSKNTANAGTTITPTLNDQNPRLTNYVVGAEADLDSEGKAKVYAVNFVGEYVDADKKLDPMATREAFNRIKLDGEVAADSSQRKTIQDINAGNVVVDANEIKWGVEGDTEGLTGVVGFTTGTNAMGIQSQPKQTFGAVENPADLVDSLIEKDLVRQHGQSTRVFGKNYKDAELSADLKDKDGKALVQSYDNSYQAAFKAGKIDGKDQLVADGNVKGIKLTHVQYGRLTTNIDRLEKFKDQKDLELVRRPLIDQDTAGAVDVYFYRGTNETTLAQMNAVKAKGGELTYLGHALTYGIDAVAPKTSSGLLPNSFGTGSTQYTLGNFVKAKFDTKTDKLEGSIYNFYNEKANNENKSKPESYRVQDLVTFSGDAVGNTVNGTALYGDKAGTFRASFFGPNAEELGGSITSIAEAQGYGEGKWGAVFGAKETKVEDNSGFNFDLSTTGTGTNVLNKGP